MVGNHLRGPPVHSRLFEVSNVFYDDGAWFSGNESDMVIKCGTMCVPTFSTNLDVSWWPGPGWQWHEYHGQSKDRDKPDIICEPSETIMDPVVVVRLYSPGWTMNPYHMYTETVLSIFMTVGLIAKMYGCPKRQVRVYVTAGLGELIFPEVWRLFFGTDPQGVPEMMGCYKKVFYGQNLNGVPQVSSRAMTYDPILSSWMAAYGANLRAGLVRADLLKEPQSEVATILFVYHPREPDWLGEVDWRVPGIVIQHVRFQELPYRTQVERVAVARGLLGIAGSGLAQQLFLPPRSLVGIVPIFEGTDPRKCCWTILNKKKNIFQPEQNVLNYISTAINVGHTSLMWRWCNPNVYERHSRFDSEHAQAVVRLLLSLGNESAYSSTTHACLVLDKPNASGWPRCDQHVVAPAPRLLDDCETYGQIGLPYNRDDNSSFTVKQDGMQWVIYHGGHRIVQANGGVYKGGKYWEACR